jgi:hypothetical protein
VTSRSPAKAGAGERAPSWGRIRLLAALVPLALLAPGDASGQAAAQVASETLERDPAAVRGYWTPERMRAARPVARRLDERPTSTASSEADSASRRPQQANSGAYPGRTNGKVFLTIPGLGDFFCSGTVVRSGGRNLVVTAGHCVYDDVVGRFATNWTFVPGYRDGREPYGEWVAQRLATTPQWRASGDLRYDVGVAVVHRDRKGRGVQDVVGGLEIAFNQPRDQDYRAFGYPAQGEFDGERLYRCHSPYEGPDQSFSPPRPMRIHCEMTSGASGGGWVTDDRDVVSVISYGYEHAGEPVTCLVDPELCPEKDKLFGPYFGSEVAELYRANRGREVRCGGRVVTNRGTRGPDRLDGTDGADVMHGLRADDVLRGLAGDDVICGGPGDDRLFGGPGNNRILTGPGADRVFVRARGRNRVVARHGVNRVRCGPGRDVVIANRRTRVHRSCNRVIRR